MKNNEEFRESVFRKVREFEKKRKEKRQKFVRSAITLTLCVLFAVPVLYIPFGMLAGNMSAAEMTVEFTSFTTVKTNPPYIDLSSPNGFSEAEIEFEFFYNGAYSVLREELVDYVPQIIYEPTKKTEKYFSEKFFEKNVLINLNFYTQDCKKPYLADMNITEDGVIEIVLLAVEGKVPDFCQWDMFISVSRDNLPDGEITFDIKYEYDEE